MPKFFKWVMGISVSVSAIALAIQMALNSGGAMAPEWWNTIYPYRSWNDCGIKADPKALMT